MALPASPASMDELDAYRFQHRVLGAGMLLGGITGLAVGVAAAWTTGTSMLWMTIPGLLVTIAGAGHMVIGANLWQRRAAKRMMDSIE